MLVLLSLVACGLFGPQEPPFDAEACSAESTALAEDLAKTAAILSYRIPEVEALGEHLELPQIGAPLRASGATKPVLVMEADNRVRVGTKAAISVNDEALVSTLEGALSQLSAPTLPAAPAGLSPLPAQAWSTWAAARSKPAPTLAIDAHASGLAASTLLAALYEAGAHEVELVVKLSKPPSLDSGSAPAGPGADAASQVWGTCDTSWTAAVQAAPPAMRPWVFADKAPPAYAACACKPEAAQVRWLLTSQFEAPTHATVRLRLSPKGKKVTASPAFVVTARDLVEAGARGGAVWLEKAEKPAVPRVEHPASGTPSTRPLSRPAFGPRKGR